MTTSSTRGGLTRRTFAAGAAVGALGTAAAVTGAEPAHAEQPFRAVARKGKVRRPNILVILADDLGSADLSVLRLAPHQDAEPRQARGVRACGSPRATRPARSARRPGSRSTPAATRAGRPAGCRSRSVRRRPPNGIPPEHPTLGSLLKGAATRTSMVGKWHGGFLPWFSPLKSGWDYFYGNYSGGIDYFSKLYAKDGYDQWEGEQQVQDPRYYLDILTEKAVGVVRRERPAQRSRGCSTSTSPARTGRGRAAATRPSATTSPRGSTPATAQALFHDDGGSLEKYVEMVENLDSAIGTVLDELQAHRAGQATRSCCSRATTAASGSPTTGRSPATRPASTRAASGCR